MLPTDVTIKEVEGLFENSCQQPEGFICQSCLLAVGRLHKSSRGHLPLDFHHENVHRCFGHVYVLHRLFCKVHASRIVRPLWTVQTICMCMVSTAVWEFSMLFHMGRSVTDTVVGLVTDTAFPCHRKVPSCHLSQEYSSPLSKCLIFLMYY